MLVPDTAHGTIHPASIVGFRPRRSVGRRSSTRRVRAHGRRRGRLDADRAQYPRLFEPHIGEIVEPKNQRGGQRHGRANMNALMGERAFDFGFDMMHFNLTRVSLARRRRPWFIRGRSAHLSRFGHAARRREGRHVSSEYNRPRVWVRCTVFGNFGPTCARTRTSRLGSTAFAAPVRPPSRTRTICQARIVAVPVPYGERCMHELCHRRALEKYGVDAGRRQAPV